MCGIASPGFFHPPPPPTFPLVCDRHWRLPFSDETFRGFFFWFGRLFSADFWEMGWARKFTSSKEKLTPQNFSSPPPPRAFLSWLADVFFSSPNSIHNLPLF